MNKIPGRWRQRYGGKSQQWVECEEPTKQQAIDYGKMVRALVSGDTLARRARSESEVKPPVA